MSDVMPNAPAEIQRLYSRRADLVATQQRQWSELYDIQDRASRLAENILATDAAVEEIDAEIGTMEAAHGAVDEAARRQLLAGLTKGR